MEGGAGVGRACVAIAAVGAAVALAGCGGGRSAPPSGASPAAAGPLFLITKVTDGDTVHVIYAGHDERVRLIGINTPEVDWYGGRAECFGAEAGTYTRRRLDGRTVRLAFDSDRYDRYGRLLAYVYLGRELFNLTLAEDGYARADPVPPDTRIAATFARAEDEARAAGRGLWSACPT